MRKFKALLLFMAISVLVVGTTAMAADKPNAVYGSGANKFSLATGSPGELGLLKVLGEAFGKQEKAALE